MYNSKLEVGHTGRASCEVHTKVRGLKKSTVAMVTQETYSDAEKIAVNHIKSKSSSKVKFMTKWESLYGDGTFHSAMKLVSQFSSTLTLVECYSK